MFTGHLSIFFGETSIQILCPLYFFFLPNCPGLEPPIKCEQKWTDTVFKGKMGNGIPHLVNEMQILEKAQSNMA